MEEQSQFVINLRDQKAPVADYQWTLDDEFFTAVGATEVQRGHVEVRLSIHRMSVAFELTFSFSGTVTLPCDHCLADMQQPIQAERTLRAKLGDEYDDDGELVTVPYTEGTLDVAWLMYEFIALEIPLRHVHAECDGEETEEDI